MIRYKEFDVTHRGGPKRVRVDEEHARVAKERNGSVSVWGIDLSRGPSNDLMLVFLDADDWASIPWTEHVEGKA